MPINELTPVNEWPTRKLPQDRFDDAVKTSMDQMSVMVDELNENFIPQTNEAIAVINQISPNIDTILDAPNQAAAAAASAQAAASSKTAAAQSASKAAARKNAAASSASSASASKTDAAQSATEAAASASSAASSKTAAAQSASDAAGEANSAAQSASEAAASKNAAASSKTAAAQSATEAAASAQAAASSKTAAAQSAATAKDEADRAKDEADRVASVVAVDIASEEKAGIVRPDGVTLKVTNTSGTMTVRDVLFNGDISMVNSGLLGKARYIANSQSFNIDTDDFDLIVINSVSENSSGTFPNFNGFVYIRQYYYSRTSSTVIGNRMQVAFAYHANKMWRRYCLNGEWSSWVKVIDETDIATHLVHGIVKTDNVTTKTNWEGVLSVPIFEGSFAGLVPTATSADAKKALLGDGTWGAMEDDTASMTISEDLILTADSPRAIVLTAEVFGLSVRLPNHATLPKGTTFRLWVRPLEDIQLCDYSGQPINAYPSLAPGTAMLVQLVDASAGLWALAEYKSGSTSDAEGAPGLTVGDLLIFSSSSISNVTVVKLTETKALVCYFSSLSLYACVLTISGTTVTAGTVQSIFLGGSLNSLSVTALSESTAVLGYGMLGGSYLIKASILSISGTSIVFGDELTLATSSDRIESIYIDAVSNTSAIALYHKVQKSYAASVLTVSGTTITEGNSVSLANSIKGVTALSETKAIALFTRGKACVLTISGTTVSAGAEQAFTSGTISAVSATALSATKALVCYSGGKACVLTISGTTVSPGTEKAIGSGDNASVAALSEVKALVCYSDSGNSSYGTARFLSISGTTITAADEPFIFNPGTTSDVSVAAIKGNAAVVAFNSNSNAGVSGVIAIN